MFYTCLHMCVLTDKYSIDTLMRYKHWHIIDESIKKIVNFKKGIGIERYTQFTIVTLIHEKSA